MTNLTSAFIFLLFEFNIKFSTVNSTTVHSVYLIPRFVGYLCLLLVWRAPALSEDFSRKRVFFFLMFFFELFRWIGALFFYNPTSSQVATTFSVIATLYTVHIITNVIDDIQHKNAIDLYSQALKTIWYWMTAIDGILLLLTLFQKEFMILWLIAVIIRIRYCVQLYRSKKLLFESIPHNLIEHYK